MQRTHEAEQQATRLVSSPITSRRQHGGTVNMSAESQETAHRAIQHLEVVRTHLHALGENQMRDAADDLIDQLTAKYGRSEATEGQQNATSDRLAARARQIAAKRYSPR